MYGASSTASRNSVLVGRRMVTGSGCFRQSGRGPVQLFSRNRHIVFNRLRENCHPARFPSALLFARKGTMATEKQIEANRRNAQKSTGARTAEGKASSSRNNLRHGLTGQISLL